MSILPRLYEGSFKGAVFFVESAQTTIGRKQVKHEYPNSNRQKIQDLGGLPTNFKLVAKFGDSTTLDPRDYFQKKTDLIRALTTEGPGTLSHPWFFSSFEVVARISTIDETMAELGKGTFQLEFDISNRVTNPTPLATSLSQINQAAQEVTAAVNLDISDNFQVSTNLNINSAIELLEGFTEFLQDTTDTFNKLDDPNNNFAADVGDFLDDIDDLIDDPDALASQFLGLISASSELYETIDESLQVFIRFFPFGDDLEGVPNSTAERAERNLNNDVIIFGTQVGYLSLSYQFAANNTYTTIDDIVVIQTTLEDEYKKLVENGASESVLLPLNDLRVLANKFLESQKLNAAQVIDIKTKDMPIAVLAFNYYGDIPELQDITNTLIDLNQPLTNNPTFVKGDLQIITT